MMPTTSETSRAPPSATSRERRTRPPLSSPLSSPSEERRSDDAMQRIASCFMEAAESSLSHIGRRRFDVVFTFLVRWKRNTDPTAAAVSTRALPAIHGVAEFEEVLSYEISVYAARDVGGAAKYKAKHFLIWATVEDAPSLDFDKH